MAGAFLESCLWAMIDAREDEKVSGLVAKMLPRVLGHLRTPEFRNKALEVVTCVNNRAKGAPGVTMPIKELLEVFAAKESSPFEKNFAMLFLAMGWKRASGAETGPLVPRVLGVLGGQIAQHQTMLLHLALASIEHVKSAEWEACPAPPEAMEMLRSFLLDVMLYSPPLTAKPPPGGSPGAAAGAPAPPPSPPPPADGLSPEAEERLVGQATAGVRPAGMGAAEYIMGRKLAVLKAIQGKLLSDEAALPIALVAQCGAHHEVRKMGEDLARARANKADFEDTALVGTLYRLLLGDAQQAQPGLPPPLAPAARRAPAGIQVKGLLYANVCRSVRAANSFPECLRAVFEGLYGATSTLRTKQGAMQLASWTLKQAEDAVLRPIAGVVLTGLIKFVREMPEVADVGGGEVAVAQLRGFTYSVIGQVAQRSPELFAADVGIAAMLFGAFGTEAPEVKVSVQEALSLCCSAYEGAGPEVKERLMALLQTSIDSPAHQPRFCAVYWANRLFAFHDVRARYVCLLAVADAKTEVRDEAKAGLEPPVAPPPGAAAASLILAEDERLVAARAAARLPAFEDMVAHLCGPAVAQARRGAPAGVKAAMVAFCNRCLAEGCAKASLSRAAYLSAEGEHAANRSQAATQMQGIIEDALTAALAPLGGRGVADASLARASFQALVDLHAARPDVVAGAYGQRLKWLEAFLFCANEGTRELVAVLYGALAVRMPPAELQAVVETLAASAAGGEGLGTGLDTRLGAVAALGHTLARGGEAVPKEARLAALRLLHALVRDKRADVVCVACRALGLAGLEHPLPLAVGEPSKVEDGKASPAKVAQGGAETEKEGGKPAPQGGVEVTEGEAKKAKLGESEGAGAPAAAGDATGAGGDAAEAAEASALTELTVLGVIERLGSVLSGKERESDAYEAAARALGSICVSNRDPVVLSAAAGFLYATAGQLRVDEFHLSVGEALACVAGGRAHVSPKLLSQLKMPAAYEDATKDEERAMEEWSRVAREKEGAGMEVDGEDKGVVKEKAMEDVLAHVMEETLLHAKPQVRAAGAPWLLCLLRYGASHPVLQAKVPELQQHFTFMLGERSEFVQEVGSRGLGLVYEMCGDDKVRDELVASLAKALLSGAVAAPGKGRERDEQLFEEGTVKIDDKALGDGSLTTYKELCTVATELGQPELIYKFLNLAGHQKVWNSRRGAAFGFSFIADQAAERLKPHLPELVPKLYRYQFDPNEKVQEAMAGLWSTVAPDPAKALDEYLPNIMAELIPSCGSRLWRVREASCLGLANLLPGKRFHQMETHLLDVYRMSLRALDDVKETVRKAGLLLNRAVFGLSLRLCDPTQSGAEVAEKTLGLVLPLLLEEGITQAAEEARGTAIAQLAKVARLAGPAIRPFVARIAPVLLESLSSLEPQSNTYLQLNADKYNVSGDMLERARAAAAKGTPLAETVDVCARYIDEQGAEDAIPSLIPIIRSGVGLPTRMGVAKFVGQLALSLAAAPAVRRHSARLLKTLANSIGPNSGDRSAVVRQAMAGAAARVVAVAKEAAVDEYIKQLTTLYGEAGPEDPAARLAVGVALKEVLSSASDAARDFLPLILPIAFIARFDDEAASKELFQQVWDEGAGATATGVRLYGAELTSAISVGLTAPHWSSRKCAALAAAAFASALGDGVQVPLADALLAPLIAAVGGKVWDGKEQVLEALVAAAGAVPGGLPAEGDTSPSAIATLLVGEAAKKRPEYRMGALKSLTKFLKKHASGGAVDVSEALLEATSDLFGGEGASDPEASPKRAGVSAGRTADEEAHYEARMEVRAKREHREVAIAALAAAFPAAASSSAGLSTSARARFAPAFLALLDPPLRTGEGAERAAAAKAGLSFAPLALPSAGDAATPGWVAASSEEQGARDGLLQALLVCLATQGPTFKVARLAALGTAAALLPSFAQQGWRSESGITQALGKAATALMEEDDMAVRAAATKLRDVCQ